MNLLICYDNFINTPVNQRLITSTVSYSDRFVHYTVAPQRSLCALHSCAAQCSLCVLHSCEATKWRWYRSLLH